MNAEFEIEPLQLAEELKSGRQLKLIDVREPHELQISHIEGAELIPLGDLAAALAQLDTAGDFVLICRSGARSGRAVELMHAAGFRHARNLVGGINRWVREVDPSQPLY